MSKSNMQALKPRVRITILLLFAGILAIALFCWWSLLKDEEQMRSILLSEARMAAKGINWRHVQALTASEADLASPDYQRLKEQLAMVRAANPQQRFTYLIGQRPDNSLFFFVDSESPDSKDYSPPGQDYTEAADVFKQIFATGHESVTRPVKDRWGKWITTLVPIINPETGKLLALFCVDRDAVDWNRNLVIKVTEQLALYLMFVVPLIVFLLLRQRNERFLRATRQYYLDIIQFYPDATLVIDSQGKVTAWNHAMEEFSGIKAEEILGKGDYEYALPFYGERRPILIDLVSLPQEELEGKYSQIERRGNTLFSDAYINNARGEKHYFNGTASALRNNSGEIIGAIESIRDVTERKRTEEEICFKNLILATVQECSIDGILVIDDNTRIISYNQRFVEIWNIPGEMVEAGTDEAVLLFVAGQLLDTEAFLARVRYLYAHREEKSQEEIFLKDGRVFDRYSAPMTGSDGRYYGRVWYFSDITLRKQMEVMLKKAKTAAEENAQRLEFVLEGSNDGTWEWDIIADQVVINTKYYEITGYHPGEVDLNFAFFMGTIHPDDVSEVQMRIQEHLEGKSGGFEAHYRMVTKSGKLQHVMMRGKVVRYDEDGRPTWMAGVVTDVTELKRLGDEVNKIHNLESIGLLAGGMAHDFNNVLNIVYGNISFAKMLAGSNTTFTEPLTDAEEACERAKELGIRLQALSQGSTPVRESIVLPTIIEDVAGVLFKDTHISHNISTTVDILPVEADPRQLRQVFENLLANAKENMSDGGTIKINIENYVADSKTGLPIRSGNYVCITLQDDGKGIPAENLPKIFDPYFSTKDTYSQKGLGLGLSICHAILKKHNGHISVESTVGIGTKVTVYLPASE